MQKETINRAAAQCRHKPCTICQSSFSSSSSPLSLSLFLPPTNPSTKAAAGHCITFTAVRGRTESAADVQAYAGGKLDSQQSHQHLSLTCIVSCSSLSHRLLSLLSPFAVCVQLWRLLPPCCRHYVFTTCCDYRRLFVIMALLATTLSAVRVYYWL